MNEQMQLHNDDISIKEVLSPLWSRRWLIVFFTLVITLIVAIYLTSLKPSYKAEAILQIGSNKPTQALSIDDAFDESNATKEQIQTQYELLRSRKFAERVIIRLQLMTNVYFTGGKYKEDGLIFSSKANPNTKLTLPAAVKRFQSNLSISPIDSTELVKISYSSYDGKLSQRVANQIGVTYLQYQDEIHTDSQETTSQWLVDQLEELGKKLEASEIALQQYKEQEKIVDIRGVAGLVSGELTELTSAALKAEREAARQKVVYDFIRNNKDDLKELSELEQVKLSASYHLLRNSEESLERKVSELSKRYGPKHPKLIAAQTELESIGNRIAVDINIIVQSIEKSYAAATVNVVDAKKRLAEAKENFLVLSRLENKFSQLQREVQTNKDLYDTYLKKLKEADAMGNYRANFYVRFIDKAIAPHFPYKPNKTLLTIAVLVMSFIMISIIIIMRELMIDTLNSRRKLDQFTEAPVLAVLPRFKRDQNKPKSIENYYGDNRFIEAVRSLRTSLLFAKDKEAPKVIAITSSVPNEGKSTVALELARSYSEMEKVLLIEGDLRHPTIAKNIGLEPNRPGLSNLLAKTHEINECIFRDKNIKLDILTSGITPSNPLAFLSMKRFSMLLKVFGNFYDRIIIETPPVNAVSDAVIISKHVDSVLYIVHGGKTKREQITTGLRMLKQVSAPIEGVVINNSENIDTSKYQNKYYNDMANIIKLPVKKQG